MAKSIFTKYKNEFSGVGIEPRTKESREWFMDKLDSLKNINRTKILKDENLLVKNVPKTGSMYMYFYDPKTKETLPYYDRFPLVIMIEPAPGGFYGLNLHYLPPILRARMLDALIMNTNNKRFDESTRMKINYSMLTGISKLRWYEPCFKRYLFKHIQMKMVMVPAPEWEIATFLPTEQFKKSRKTTVWKESKKLLGKP